MTTGFQVNGIDFDSAYITKAEFYDYSNLWGVGNNLNYNLGIGDNVVVNVARSPIEAPSRSLLWTKKYSTSNGHTMAIKSDGTLWGWGKNDLGQLGDGTVITRSSPVKIGTNTNWSQVGCGSTHTLAIKADGTLWSWGEKGWGALGDGVSGGDRSSPVQIGIFDTANTWKQISVGSQFNAALKGDGIVYTWGRNSNGQCGVNHTFPVFSPNSLNVSGDYYTFSDAKISCGVEHMVVAKANGTIWAWGRNDSGQLGDGTTTDRSVPVEIISGGINTWKRAVAGTSHTMAIKNDGTLWGWGNNSFGQLGDITTTSTSSPVQDMSLSTNWRQVICGFNFSSGLKTDGTIWSWGDNSLGQLGIGDTTSKSSAVQISGGGSNWIHIACGPASNTAFYLGENKF